MPDTVTVMERACPSAPDCAPWAPCEAWAVCAESGVEADCAPAWEPGPEAAGWAAGVAPLLFAFPLPLVALPLAAAAFDEAVPSSWLIVIRSPVLASMVVATSSPSSTCALPEGHSPSTNQKGLIWRTAARSVPPTT